MTHKTDGHGAGPSCSCQSRRKTPDGGGSVPLERFLQAVEEATHTLKKHVGDQHCLMTEGNVQTFKGGFGVARWAITEGALTVAATGVVDQVPTRAVLKFNTRFFDHAGEGAERDILWVNLEISSPTKQVFKVPFRGVGVLRDPGGGNVMRCESFELATDLIADVGDIAKVIACVLACVGLFCAALCAAACVAVIACIACLAACVGSRLPQFLVCVRACGIALDEVEDAIEA